MTMDATYTGQIVIPWQRKLAMSRSTASKEHSRLEYRPLRICMVWRPGSSGVSRSRGFDRADGLAVNQDVEPAPSELTAETLLAGHDKLC
jgi:hypothetical protein